MLQAIEWPQLVAALRHLLVISLGRLRMTSWNLSRPGLEASTLRSCYLLVPVVIIDPEPGKLYVCCDRYQSQVGFNQKGKWNYSTQVAEEILNILDTRQYRSIREIASDCGMSRQLVFVYLEALAYIGMVGINESGYKVLSKEGILMLGTFIQPGILGKCVRNQA